MPAGSDADRPVVYLLHGLLETVSGHFPSQIGSWSQGCQLVAINLPGHGDCPVDARDGYMSIAVEYATAVLDRYGAGRLVGASYLGGPVAVRCAQRRGELVSSIVLTGFVPEVPQDAFVRWVNSIRSVAERSAEMAAAYDATHGLRWRRTLSAYEADVAERYGADISVTRDMLADLRSPVLIANGSRKTAERKAALCAASIGPHIQGVTIGDAGHIPGRDQPKAFEDAVAAFWWQSEREAPRDPGGSREARRAVE